jgi:hypothetical protein
MTEPEVAEVMKQYDNWKAYKDGKVSADVYYNANAGDEAAQNVISNAVNPETQQTAAREKAKELLAQQYAVTSKKLDSWVKNAKVVVLNTGTVTSYTDFNGDIGPNDDQEAYWKALKADLGKVEVGQYIIPNYGWRGASSNNEYFLCVAPGVFVAMPGSGVVVPSRDKIYTPNGYKVNRRGGIEED